MIRTALLSLLLILLPWHGLLTTLGPEWIRWWKEGILAGLLVMGLGEIRRSRQYGVGSTGIPQWAYWLLGFFLYGIILVTTHAEPHYALIAFRYLSMGYLCFLTFSLQKPSPPTAYCLLPSSLFLASCSLSVLFGLWAQYFGGFEILAEYYSSTISSWVPGQTLPLYHEANGLIRMQGGASGPVAFGHLLVGAVFVLLFNQSTKYQALSTKQILNTKDQKTKHGSFEFKISNLFGTSNLGFRIFSLLLLLLGIFLSYTRAAWIATAVILITWLIKKWRKDRNLESKNLASRNKQRLFNIRNTQYAILNTLILALLLPTAYFLLPTSQLLRPGTSLHLTRPLQAMKDGMTSPLIGQLASYGPAARIKNLREKDNDQAPLTENVLLDYWVQLGLIGLILIFGFWISLWKTLSFEGRLFGIILLLTTSLSSLFDMIPVAMVYFWILSPFLDRKTNDTSI